MTAINTSQISLNYPRALAAKHGLNDYSFVAFVEDGTPVLQIGRGKETYEFGGADISTAARFLNTYKVGAPKDHPVIRTRSTVMGVPLAERDRLHEVLVAVCQAAGLPH